MEARDKSIEGSLKMGFIKTFEEWAKEIQSAVPILMYHKIGKCPMRTNTSWLYVSPSCFREKMGAVMRAKFRTISMEDALEGQRAIAPRFVITFDDGYECVLKHAAECLRQDGFTAMQFLVADRLGRMNEWDLGLDPAMERLMDRTQVREWLSLGHEIGAHTLTHPRLTEIPLSRAREEIHSSKKKLEDLFGIPVKHFAYPYGDYNQQIVGIVQEAGFHTACTADPGCVRAGGDPLRLNRLTVREWELPNWIAYKVRKSLADFAHRGKCTINASFGTRQLAPR
jgi:peptidoglycan/xylan/chitin deacetylase (PgdA/CDA1 family)